MVLGMAACAPPDTGRCLPGGPLLPADAPPAGTPSNVLVVVVDDFGTDQVSAYAEHPLAPPTPVIDGLAARGVLFRNAYAHPSCSPSRAGLLTGRSAIRTGGGANYLSESARAFPSNELTLPEMLSGWADDRWETAAVGKWHLAGLRSPDALRNPLDQGFDTHRGTHGNLSVPIEPDRAPLGYFRWERVVDGQVGLTRCYATTAVVDDALDVIGGMGEPWLVWVAFHAPHSPWHVPPDALLAAPVAGDTPVPFRYAAAVRALDLELGRLLEGLGEDRLARTTVVLVGDNGTPADAVLWPRRPEHAKLTLYEGGINVPLIVAGPEVRLPGRESPALVQIEDLFPTVAALAGVDVGALVRDDGTPAVLDGHSLLPVLQDPDAVWPRQFVLAEDFPRWGPPPYPVVARAVRDEAFKLVIRRSEDLASAELYDLRGRHDDGPDLLAHGAALDPEPEDALERLLEAEARFDAIPYEGPTAP